MSKMKVYINPQPYQFPDRGGVREHLRLLYKHLQNHVQLVNNPFEADILHVESTWNFPDLDKPKIYVCHGGFVPQPIPTVLKNLNRANIIVSVADWLSDKYFPELTFKTVCIPNGVDFQELSNFGLEKEDYILYAKEWPYYLDDLEYLVYNMPEQQFVTTVWAFHDTPKNVKVIGLQDKVSMMKYLAKAKILLITGSEVCPTMLLEAWALGTSVLAKNIDGSREIIKNSGNLFSGYKDQKEISFVLRNLIGLLPYYSKVCPEFIAKNHDWSRLVDKYIEIYDSLL